MMDLRSLLFPIGYFASLIFFLRFYIQWLQSEKIKKSHITPLFWKFSLAANFLMAVHALIQSQFPICLIQSMNAIISLRNLDLMRRNGPHLKLSHVIILMIFAAFLIPALFLLMGPFVWMRSPSHQELSFLWHLFGFLGMGLFASRFWIQWVIAEKEKVSQLHASFWILSLVGGICSLIYSLRLVDFVQIVSFGLGLLPYIRNLALLKKSPFQQSSLNKSSLFFVAGETSGDLLGKKLIDALQKQSSSITLEGVGGSLMAQTGMKTVLSIDALNVMGFTDVILAFPRLLKAFHHIKRSILSLQPEKVILIDYQDFNMFLAKSLRKNGYTGQIIHYVSPSVWAWRKKRMFKMAKTHNLLLSIFPFEKPFYAQTTLPVEYVGHPLVESIQEISYVPSWKESQGFHFDQKILTLFPGSRPHEIVRNLSIHLETAKKFISSHPDFRIAISVARSDFFELIENELKKFDLKAILIDFKDRYDLMKATTLALATSGTVTLELALHNVPTITTYLLSLLNYCLARYIFRIRLSHYCIVNIIGGKEIFPEFIDKALSSEAIVDALKKLYDRKLVCYQDLDHIRNLMGFHKTSSLAASHILSFNPNNLKNRALIQSKSKFFRLFGCNSR